MYQQQSQSAEQESRARMVLHSRPELDQDAWAITECGPLRERSMILAEGALCSGRLSVAFSSSTQQVRL